MYNQTQPEPIKKVIEPTTRLMWPELQDDHLENSRKVPLDRHDIIIDKVNQRLSAIMVFGLEVKGRLDVGLKGFLQSDFNLPNPKCDLNCPHFLPSTS